MTLENMMRNIGQQAQQASFVICQASSEVKNNVLKEAAAIIRKQKDFIITENQKDMIAAKEKDLSAAMLDRLELTQKRIEAIAISLEKIAASDPVGRVLNQLNPENGLKISRISTQLGCRYYL